MKHPLLKRNVFKTLKYIFLSLYALTTAFPLYWTFVQSFRSNSQIFSRFALLPESFSNLKNYEAMLATNLPIAFWNTFSLTALSMLLLMFCAILASFVLSVYRFRFAKQIYTVLMMGIVIPRLSVLISTYMNFNTFGFLGEKYPLAFCYTAFELPMAVYLIVGFMRSLSSAIYESATIDGCNSGQLLWYICLPMSRNGIVTALIVAAVSVWNEYIYAMIFLTKKTYKTITAVIAAAKTEFITDYGMQMAGVVLTIAPIIIIYFFLQDKIINGMAMGAVKG